MHKRDLLAWGLTIISVTSGLIAVIICIPARSEQTVILVHDNRENHVRHIRLIEGLFAKKNYNSYEIYEEHHIRTYHANRVILIYSGHGSDQENVQLYLRNNYSVSLDTILAYIEARELILMTESCFGGHWLKYGAENRIIITAVQKTYAHELYYQYSFYGIAGALPNLIAISFFENVSLEKAYEIWRDEIIVPWWETEPGIYDGIAGEVFL